MQSIPMGPSFLDGREETIANECDADGRNFLSKRWTGFVGGRHQ